MKKILFLTAILFVTAYAQTLAAQGNYKTYGNARFGYSISYPSNLLTPQGEADNGDGQMFTGDGAEMRVFGSNMLLKETLQKEYNHIIDEHGAKNVTYKLYRANYFVVSGKENGKIFYQKTMKNSKGAFITFIIEYDESKRSVYDQAVAKIAKSFK